MMEKVQTGVYWPNIAEVYIGTHARSNTKLFA